MRLTLRFVIAGLVTAAIPAGAQDTEHRTEPRDMARSFKARTYQGRNNGPEQTERFSRKVKVGRDGRVSIANISGDIVVTAGSGDDVSIDAVKRTRSGQGDLASVRIEVEERGGRVDVQTLHTGRNDRVSVDYTVVMPATASVDVHSVSGSVKVTGVHGSVRAETVSGNVATTDTPRLESAKSVSGDVYLTGAAADGDLSASSVSGNVTAKGLKARGLDLGSVSGDISLSDVSCDRLTIKTVSGNVEYAGTIVRNGRYEIASHSGTVRLLLANPSGFELNANSFSGSIRSELPLTIGGDSAGRDRGPRDARDRGRRRDGSDSRAMRATFGDGGATVTVRTFSGNVIIAKR
jgi:DUF4097 and DUF4098 domain-containing protein YvlB